VFSNYTNVNEMLHSGGVKHCKSRYNKSDRDPCHWAERDATLPENGIQTGVKYRNEYDNGYCIDIP
jgi:hypothetical protein